MINPKRQEALKVEGKVGVHECDMTIDTGAQQTVVRAGLVVDEEYTGETISLVGV